MTRAQGRANWIRQPSLCDQWIASTLHTLAMLVLIVARLFAPKPPNPTAECDGSPAQTPEANDVLDQLQEPTAAIIITATRQQQRSNSAAASTRAARRDLSAEARRTQAEAFMLRTIAAWGTPPLEKGRSEHASRKAKLATGGDLFDPHPPNFHPRPLHEVIPTPTSLRENRTSPFQGEVNTPPA
jgi:hypothetical protein